MRRLVALILVCVALFFAKSQIPNNDPDVVTIDEVRLLKENSTVLFVDVREPYEISGTGLIPGSINIPLDTLKRALEELSGEEFKERYGRNLPDHDTPIVFTCRTGNRSRKAMYIARGLGYRNVRHYEGGWVEWEKDNNFSDL